MWFRFLCISLLKWLVSLVALIVMLRFILPGSFTGWLLMVPSWFLAFLIAFIFAYWALSKRMSTRRDLFTLLIIWLAVTVIGWLAYGILYSIRGPWVVAAPEFLIQLALEVIAIFLAAYRTRLHKVQAVLGEGMTV